jgi:hypothetical protein
MKLCATWNPRAHIWQPYCNETQYLLDLHRFTAISTIAFHLAALNIKVAALVKGNESAGPRAGTRKLAGNRPSRLAYLLA